MDANMHFTLEQCLRPLHVALDGGINDALLKMKTLSVGEATVTLTIDISAALTSVSALTSTLCAPRFAAKIATGVQIKSQEKTNVCSKGKLIWNEVGQNFLYIEPPEPQGDLFVGNDDDAGEEEEDASE